MRTAYVSLAFVLLLAVPAAGQPAAAQPAAGQPAPGNCPHPTAGRAPPSPALIAARRAERQACAADMTRFCANVPRGCGRPKQCLRAHRAELSAPCTNAMAQQRAARVQSRAPSPAAAQH